MIDDESMPWPGPISCCLFGAVTFAAAASAWLWHRTRPPRRRR